MNPVLLTVLQASTLAIAGAPDLGEPSAAVKSCITTHAPGVERTIDSLNEGTDFLVQKACIAPIADQTAEAAKKASDAHQQRQDKMCEDMQKSAAASSAQAASAATGEVSFAAQMCDPATRALYADAADLGMSSYFYMQAAGSAPKATSLAAQTLLQLRMARTKPK